MFLNRIDSLVQLERLEAPIRGLTFNRIVLTV